MNNCSMCHVLIIDERKEIKANPFNNPNPALEKIYCSMYCKMEDHYFKCHINYIECPLCLKFANGEYKK